MKVQLIVPPSLETHRILGRLKDFRENSYDQLLATDPAKFRNHPFRVWSEKGLPPEIDKEIRDFRISQKHIWKSWIHDIDIGENGSPGGHQFVWSWLMGWGLAALFLVLPILLFVSAKTAGLIMLVLIPVVILLVISGIALTKWAQSAADLDLAVVQEHHDLQRKPFEKTIEELVISYGNDLRGEGYEIAETSTTITGVAWRTRYTAINGEVELRGDLNRETITATASKSHLRPKWGSTESTLDYGTVLDLDGNPIAVSGMTTRGVWA